MGLPDTFDIYIGLTLSSEYNFFDYYYAVTQCHVNVMSCINVTMSYSIADGFSSRRTNRQHCAKTLGFATDNNENKPKI